jgi:hypothetical protein
MRIAPALAALPLALILVVAAVAGPPVATEPAAPPLPPKYDVTIRYSLDAPRNQRAPRFKAMYDFLKKHGFTRDEDRAPEDEEENPAYTLMNGTVPSAEARGLLGERHVRALRLVPAGSALPAADAPVRVQLDLAGGPLIEPGRYLYGTAMVRQAEYDGGAFLQRQRVLADQVRAVLARLGFSEAVGYDTRAHTRLLGTIPAGKLDELLDDLRRQPSAWQLPNEPPIDTLLLGGLRNQRGGTAVLEGILGDWDAYFEAKRREADEAPKGDTPARPAFGKDDDLIGKLVAAWAQQPAAVAYLQTLPPEVRASETITRGLLRAHLVGHPDSTGVLRDLWRQALSSPYGPDLFAVLLRRLPSAVLGQLPQLLRTDSPIRVTEVQLNLPQPAARPKPPDPAPGDEKLSPELRALLGGPNAGKPQRLDVLLALAPEPDDRAWQRQLVAAAPGLVVEGHVGPLVSVYMPPAQARPRADDMGRWTGLTALPIVSAVRLPVSGEPREVAPAAKMSADEVLRSNGLDRLHKAGYRGRGVLLAVIDGDFRGWQGLVGGKLPARTRLLDLTAERNPNLLPDAVPAEAGLGHGTQIALAAAVAAPEADLLLIRIDPAAPYQLLTLARAMNGEPHRSLNLTHRADYLELRRSELDSLRGELRKTRAAQMQKAPDRTQKGILLKKKEKGTLSADEEDLLKDIEEFEDYLKKQAQLDADQRDYDERHRRYLRLEEELRDLRRVRVVATGLAWYEGQPVDGGGALGRHLDDQPFKNAVWFQAVGDTRGQAWADLFRDRDSDGVMEFVPAGTHLPPGRWSASLAFLAWQPSTGAAVADLPANARLRLSIQWREPHDPDFLRHGQDAYRTPLASPRLLLLRQLDPTGTKQPADDFQVVAQTTGLPQRLDNQADSAVYEQAIEFTVPAGGRYALRVEGRVPYGIRPAGEPTVPAAERLWELRPRLFVNTVAGAGRVVLADFATAQGALGTPADARQPITVGAADASGRVLPSSASGVAFGMELSPRPAVLSPVVGTGAGAAPGTSLSAGFAAGLAASAVSAGAPADKLLRSLGTRPGTALRVPDRWPATRP